MSTVYECDDLDVRQAMRTNTERFFQSLGRKDLCWIDLPAVPGPCFENNTSREVRVCLCAAFAADVITSAAVVSAKSHRDFIMNSIIGACQPSFVPSKIRKCVECQVTMTKGAKTDWIQCCRCFCWRHSRCIEKCSSSSEAPYVCTQIPSSTTVVQ